MRNSINAKNPKKSDNGPMMIRPIMRKNESSRFFIQLFVRSGSSVSSAFLIMYMVTIPDNR
ncbi:hypothetical protein ACFL3M_01040 [Patescibacteria group bacterium]